MTPRKALLRLAEWCLTEDSELSIRIHALGYRSVYLTEPLGRGLIPETFAGYRQQRFRWTCGPVQELRRHLRLFLPRPLARALQLSWRQRLHHANHGLDVALVGVRTLAAPLGAIAGLSMILRNEVVEVPFELWTAATAMLVGTLSVRWLALPPPRQSDTAASARWSPCLSRPHPRHHRRQPHCAGESGRALAAMLAIGLAVLGVTYLAAPIVVGISEYELRRQVV